MITYPGDNYPNHQSAINVSQSTTPVGRSINYLAYALGEQDDVVKKLHARLERALSPLFPPPGSETATGETKSDLRSDIDLQSSRIRATNAALSELLDRLEI